MYRFIEAALILVGMIIGVGMFGIPFSFAQAGFWLGAAELVVLAVLVTALHLLYGEIVLRTPHLHRLPGYVQTYLGSGWARLEKASSFVGISGAFLAYLLVGSRFFHTIARTWWTGSSEFLWVLVLVALSAAVTRFPLKKEALINGILTGLLLAFILFLVMILFPRIEGARLSGFHPAQGFLPYGVLLFALSGAVVIPDLVTRLGRNRSESRKAIVVGSLIPALLYLLFAIAVVGSSPVSVSEEAILGLRPVVGNSIILLGSLVGLFAIFTSLTTLSMSFQALLRLDLGMERLPAWLAASFIGFFLYLLGFKNFITIIAGLGALTGGIDALLILASYHAMQKRHRIPISGVSYLWKLAIAMVILTGILYELYRFRG